MGSQRGSPFCALTSVLLLGSAAAFGQSIPSAPTPFQERIEGVARALQNSPRLKDLSEQQRIDRVEFVIGNTLFALLHELGHVIVAEMKLPVLGREEDAADTYATIRLLQVGTSFSLHALADASKNWFLNDRRDQQTGAKPLYYDEHELNQQRAYQVVCLMVGSDPGKFKSLADATDMPEPRQESCRKDYAKASWSWNTVLEPHRRASDQPGSRINVVYSEAPGPLEGFARSFRAVRILETVAQRAAADFAWPVPFTLEMRSCGRPEAAWDDKNRILRVCYELAFDFAELHRAYVPAAPAPASVNQKRKRKSK
jgi:putative metallopeptidase DUF4344